MIEIAEKIQQKPREEIISINPATGQEIGRTPVCTPEEVKEIVRKAHLAQKEWWDLGVKGRLAHFKKLKGEINRRFDEIVQTISESCGKSPFEAAMIIPNAIEIIAFYRKIAKRLAKPKRVSSGLLMHKSAYINHLPLGVAGIISPWNFPFQLAMAQTVPALMAGNAVVMKPSEYTTKVGVLIQDIFHQAGFPKDLVGLCPGYGATGAALIDAGINIVSFTGSTATGRKVAEHTGRNLLPTILELGGKAAFIVCDDADLEQTASGAVWAGFCNAGQVCVSGDRFYVTEKNAEKFTQLVVEKAKKLRQGPPPKVWYEGELNDIGSMTMPAQLDIVSRLVNEAVEKGANVLCGGKANRQEGGHFFEPTVLSQVTEDMEIRQTETFGPVIAISVVANEEEAIRLANQTHYGLTNTIWTQDTQKGLRYARRLESGSVMINDAILIAACPPIPFGGTKQSGIGRTGTIDSYKKYCNIQAVLAPKWWYPFRKQYYWYPYSTSKIKLVKKATQFLARFL